MANEVLSFLDAENTSLSLEAYGKVVELENHIKFITLVLTFLHDPLNNLLTPFLEKDFKFLFDLSFFVINHRNNVNYQMFLLSTLPCSNNAKLWGTLKRRREPVMLIYK